MEKCPTCQKYYANKENKEAIEKLSECLVCDGIRGDLTQDDLEEIRKEVEGNENNSFDV